MGAKQSIVKAAGKGDADPYAGKAARPRHHADPVDPLKPRARLFKAGGDQAGQTRILAPGHRLDARGEKLLAVQNGNVAGGARCVDAEGMSFSFSSLH